MITIEIATKVIATKVKDGYKLVFCNNTLDYVLFKANYFDSGNISFWSEQDRGVYLKCLHNRNKKIFTN